MRKITTYADYKREKQNRIRAKKCILWTSCVVLALGAVFGCGYFAGTRASAPMAQIGECVSDGGSAYMTDTHDNFICLYD